MDPRGQITHQPCSKTRKDQKREYLRDNNSESRPEVHSLHRVDYRNYQRHENSRHKVYKDGVCRYTGHIASKLTGHHRGSCRCRAYQTEHGALYEHNLVMIIPRHGLHHHEGKETQSRKQPSLHKQQPPVPPMRLEILRLYPAECQEKHREDKKRLKGADQTVQKRSDEVHRLGHDMIQKITGCTCRHRDRKHPVTYYCLTVQILECKLNHHVYTVVTYPMKTICSKSPRSNALNRDSINIFYSIFSILYSSPLIL